MLMNLKNVSLTIPIFNSVSLSFKKRILGSFVKNNNLDFKNNLTHRNLISNLNLEIKDGEKISIIGINGSGKTSLLRLLAGIYKPTSGSIQSFKSTTPLLDISLGLDPEATGIENIYLRGCLLGMSFNKIKENEKYIIEFSELNEKIYEPMRTYSLGMSMRLAFSISMFVNPEILILDEWISVGDISFVKKANKKLSELVDKSSGFIIATHSEEQILKYTTRTLLIDSGKLIMDDIPIKVYKYYKKIN